MSDLITIDGSAGEGGGQILRSSLALSTLTGRPFRIEKIRANRDKPGLMRQHLTAVNAAAMLCSAEVDGAAIGSRALTFAPGAVKAGDYTFSVGSAGSTTLVLQTVLPPLLLAERPSTLTLEGGTHNIHAPPLDFLEHAFLPIVSRMGPKVSVALERAGFYPAGGGRFFAMIEPAVKLSPIDLIERGAPGRRLCKAVVAGLPGDIALRELGIVKRAMNWPEESFQIRQLPADQGPGNIVTIEIAHEHVTEVFIGFGQRGVRAEAVAEDSLQQTKRYLASGAPVGEHLADQLVIPFALAGGGSFITQPLTAHTTTNIEVVRRFLPVEIAREQVSQNQWKVGFTRSE
jgi:RNA 3'-terminal phosphate cyclase (ATP)